MNNSSALNNNIIIRNAEIGDIAGIAALVDECGPYLSKHIPYLYLIYTRCFGDTCSVALMDGRIVGWCSTLRVSGATYFTHQLCVHPDARGRHIAFQLFAYLLYTLRAKHGDGFRLEFTADRRNDAVHSLNRKVAAHFQMNLRKLPDVLPQLETGSEEELYEMVPLRAVDDIAVRAAA